MADDRDRDGDALPRRRGLRAHVGSGLRVRRPGDTIDGDAARATAEIRPDKPTWVIASRRAEESGVGIGIGNRNGIGIGIGIRDGNGNGIGIGTGADIVTETETEGEAEAETETETEGEA